MLYYSTVIVKCQQILKIYLHNTIKFIQLSYFIIYITNSKLAQSLDKYLFYFLFIFNNINYEYSRKNYLNNTLKMI